MAIKYKPGGVSVAIGRSQDVTVPPRVFRARLECLHFDTDKCFLLPMSIPGIRNIKTYYDRHPGLTVLVNGHTDLVGDAQYNLQLSNERARSVAAYLQNKVDDWMPLYSAPIASKRWSYTEDQNMLFKVTDADGDPYYSGLITGMNDDATRDACRRFQSDSGLATDGQLGPVTRRALVTRYMELEGTSLPTSATLVMHGCGLHHPIDPTARADQGNRRVELFLFDGPVDPPAEDPCPAPGCKQYLQWVGQAIEDVDLCKPAAGVCATFFVGTTQNDDQLALARRWVQSIVAGVGDPRRAQLATLLSTRDLFNQVMVFERTIALVEKFDSPPPLGGIDLPTMVWVTRALADTGGTQAVRFYGVDDSEHAMTITADELDHCRLGTVEDPSLRQAVVTDDPSDPDLVALANLLDAMRRSSYQALYLCAVGGGRGVDQIATRLAPLIDKIVYYNDAPLVLATDDAGALVEPQVGEATAAQGQDYHGAPVALRAADTSTFLPGCERRAMP
jgi:hypothetical protein